MIPPDGDEYDEDDQMKYEDDEDDEDMIYTGVKNMKDWASTTRIWILMKTRRMNDND